MPVREVSREHAVAEGEGWSTLPQWRRDHRRYYERHGIEVTDATEVVCLGFEVIDTGDRAASSPASRLER